MNKSLRILLKILFWLAITGVVVIVMGGFDPLYKSNQSTKLLFGLAKAGKGFLSDDWLANTKNPLPVFTGLVYLTARLLDEWVFFVYQFILIGVYLFSLFNITILIFDLKRNRLLEFIFLALSIMMFFNWPGDFFWLFNSGYANQDFAYHLFLPNAFVAFLFLSIYLFLREKPCWALLALVVGCYFHTGYLIAGAALIVAYLWLDYQKSRSVKRVLTYGGLAMVLVSPLLWWQFSLNMNNPAEQVTQAAYIITNLRIPQHTIVTEWWSPIHFRQTVLVVIALVISRRTRVFPVLAAAFLFAILPIISGFIRPSNTIGLLQLWRTSVVAIPLAASIMVGGVVSALFQEEHAFFHRWRALVILALSGLVVMALVVGLRSIRGSMYHSEDSPRSQVFEFVAADAQRGDLYLLQAKDMQLESFRLSTGVPIFINWKSHPYASDEILAWYQRVEMAEAFYQVSGEERCELLPMYVADYGVTHFLLPINLNLRCEGIQKIYQNDGYHIFEVLEP